MHTRIISLLIALTIITPTLTFAAPVRKATDIKVMVNGLRIIKPVVNDDNNMRAFNWTAGTATLILATQKKDFTAEKVSMTAGTKINAGAIPLTIKKTGKPNWGNDPFSITLEAKQKLDSIADIQFFDATGKKIEADRSSTGSSGFGNIVNVTWTYNLKTKIDSAKIVISYWTDKQEVAVPFNLIFDMGL